MSVEEFLGAVKKCQVDKVRACLLEHPEFMNSVDKYGWTPLQHAAWYGHESVVKLLLRAGASVDSLSANMLTPLHYAARNGHESVVKLLLHAGSSVDSLDEGEWTPLHYAAWYGHGSVVELLVHKVSNIDSPDFNGNTPLYLAIQAEHEPPAKILKAIGASSGDLILSPEENLILQAPIPEEEILEIRNRIYFESSLVSRLLF